MDFLNSFFQNIKDKITSPFFGTLTFVIIIHHWQFWYTLFNLDSKLVLSEKIHLLSNIGNREFSWQNLVYDILCALGITISGYIIVLGTRSLSLFVDFRAMPWITGKIISREVVERKIHENVVKERDEYSEKYEEQRRNVSICIIRSPSV